MRFRFSSLTGWAARLATTWRTSFPVFASGRTTVLWIGVRTVGAAKAGITIMSLKQYRTKLFRKTAGGLKNDVTIRTELSRNDRSGWVLAGGASRRMGTDKALIEVNGQPLILLAAARAAEVCGKVSIVGDPARYARF